MLRCRLRSATHIKITKSYWVQIEGTPYEAALAQLREVVILKDGRTRCAAVTRIVPHGGFGYEHRQCCFARLSQIAGLT